MTRAGVLVAYRTPLTLRIPAIARGEIVHVNGPYGSGTLAPTTTKDRRDLFLILAEADALDVWVHEHVTGGAN